MQGKKIADLDLLQRTVQSCRVCCLEPLCLTWSLAPDEARRLENIVSHPAPLNAGDVLFRAGEKLHAIYAVRDGAIKSSLRDGSSQERILDFTLPGELLGLDGIGTGRHSSTAVALETTTVCLLPYSELATLMRVISNLHEQIMRRAGRDLRGIPDRNTALEQRLAGFLLELAERLQGGVDPVTEITLPMSWQDLSAYLGIPADVISKLFSDFVSRKLISQDTRRVRLLDRARLEVLANSGR